MGTIAIHDVYPADQPPGINGNWDKSVWKQYRPVDIGHVMGTPPGYSSGSGIKNHV